MKSRQKWIPEHLIKRAEELAKYIRKEQRKGRLLFLPPNLNANQVLTIAISIGLQKLAEEVGLRGEEGITEERITEERKPEEVRETKTETEKSETEKFVELRKEQEVKEQEVKKETSQDKDFLERLLGRFG